MDNQHAIVGIAAHFDPQGHQGAWAVVLRVDGRELALHGVLPEVRVPECEHYAMKQAISALRRLRAPLRAIEVTANVKQALVQPHLRGRHAHAWAGAREWWKSVGESAGVRVARKPNDTYSVARKMAEITAISGVEKLRLTDEELDTPHNRDHRARATIRRAEAAERRVEREAARAQREQNKARDKVNEYAIAKGRESPPPDYRPSRSLRALMSRAPCGSATTPTVAKTTEISGAAEAASLEELIALIEAL